MLKKLIIKNSWIVIALAVMGCGAENTMIVTEVPETQPSEEAVPEVIEELTSEAEDMPATISEVTEEPTSEIADTPLPEEKEDPGADEAEWLSDWQENHTRVKGIYVTGPVAGSSKMDELIELIDETDLNAVVIDLKNDMGEITYSAGENKSYISDIDALIAKLKDHGIYTIARIVCFKDPVFAENSPEQALLKGDGKPVTDGAGNAWVNPCDKVVWEHIATYAEAAGEAGFDEIQFDYVRFPVGTDADQADYGIELDENTKTEILTEFFDYMTERLHSHRIIVGADLFGTVIGSDIDKKLVGQDYLLIIRQIDVVSPMIYPSHYASGSFGLSVPDAYPYDTVYSALKNASEVAEETDGERLAVVRPWLQAFTATWVKGHIEYKKAQINEQIRAVTDAGYEEWILWNASNKYGSYK